jgi:hypothetical protein
MKLLSCLFVCLFLVTTSYAQEKPGGQGGKSPSSPSTEPPYNGKSGGPGAGDPNPNINFPSGFVFPENTNSGSGSRSNGASAGQASGAGTNSSRSAVLQGNFPRCPFGNLNFNEFIKPEYLDELSRLAESTKTKQTDGQKNCQKVGEDIANLSKALSTSGYCNAEPSRCSALIGSLVKNLEENKNCVQNKGLDVLIGAATRIVSFIPGPGWIPMALAGLNGLVQFIRNRKVTEDDPSTINRNLLDLKMDALNACYADQLYQDTNCREHYTLCLIKKSTADNRYCANGMEMGPDSEDIELTSEVPGSRGFKSNSCGEFERIKDNKSITTNRKFILKKCLVEVENKNKNSITEETPDEDFKIESSVMSDIYACVSYWINVEKTKKQRELNSEESKAIKKGCLNDKKTKGGFSINSYTFFFNQILDDNKSTEITAVRDQFLPPILKQANLFYEKKIQEAQNVKKVWDRNEANNSVKLCYYGYGISLATKNQITGTASIPNKCSALSSCVTKVQGRINVEIPNPNDDFYKKIDLNQSLEQMFLGKNNNNQNKFESNVGQICYGMAMNNLVNHNSVADHLITGKFDGTNCSQNGPVDEYEILDSGGTTEQ